MIALVYGTRPQVVKASVLLRALAARGPVLAVDTGQHYDYALNAGLYAQLGVRAPDVLLGVGSGGHGPQTARVLEGVAALLAERRPRAAVVIGDTNSTLAGALAAAKLRVPVVHVEAGLRCGDALMAEEINRRAVDAISTVLCAPSAATAAQLAREGAGDRTVVTGDVARDVLCGAIDRAPPVRRPGGGAFVFATLHRAELVDDPARLAAAVRALAALPLPVVLAAHPRTRARLDALAPDALAPDAVGLTDGAAGVEVVPALGYFEALAHARDAAAVVTDSGGVQREAYWLGTPCVTLRGETEWAETVALGANRLVAPALLADDAGALARAVEVATAAPRGWDRDVYGAGDAAARVADAVEALLHRDAPSGA